VSHDDVRIFPVLEEGEVALPVATLALGSVVWTLVLRHKAPGLLQIE
jgi:hypothetical protein